MFFSSFPGEHTYKMTKYESYNRSSGYDNDLSAGRFGGDKFGNRIGSTSKSPSSKSTSTSLFGTNKSVNKCDNCTKESTCLRTKRKLK